MNEFVRHPLAMDGKDPSNLRGDPITQERYYSPDFMQREWDRLWTRIWHIAGRVKQLQEAGDYIVHNFMRESVIIVKQADNSLKGFYGDTGSRISPNRKRVYAGFTKCCTTT